MPIPQIAAQRLAGTALAPVGNCQGILVLDDAER
jgi:hypothetical protein